MIEKNDVAKTTIIDLSSKGEGIGKIDGYTLFIPFTAIGDRVRVRVVYAGKTHGYGEILDVIKPSEDRVSPLCGVYGKCGGCDIMHINYQGQLNFKKQKVVDALERIGGFKNIEVADVKGMETPFHYRNKTQLPVGYDGDKRVAGFYAPRSHKVVPSQGCILQHKENEKYVNAVLGWMDRYKVTAYNEEKHEGVVRHIYTRIGFRTGEVMVSVVANSAHLPYERELCSALEGIKLPGLTLKSVVHNVNTKKTNVIIGKESRVLLGRGYIYDKLDGLKFKISHNSFYQVNPPMTEALYSKVVQLLGNVANKKVFDIYCGIGTISLFIAKSAGEVVGCESVSEAVLDAKENAEINNIKNAVFYKGDANKVIPSLYKKGVVADVAVVDPPRKGLGADILNTLIKMSPQKIVYVSCNVATLARDLKFLCKYGYTFQKAYPFDLFPNTNHVECVIGMQRKDT